MNEKFGRLVKRPPREGWVNEASEFTPWLADNLDLLADELGIALQLREREHTVGRYSLDLLLEDEQQRTIIVENQLEQTDHAHLGQLLTYCAGTKADIVVWIAPTMTPEHRAALEWLNENTVAEVGFFGVELELLRIDGVDASSALAPHFRVVVKPNEWAKRVRPTSPQAPPQGGWDFEKYENLLRIPKGRIDVASECLRRLQETVSARGLPWTTAFRKGYVAIQRAGGYNVFIVDLWWNKPPRIAMKLPAEPSELGLVDPYPHLRNMWLQSQREWGWQIETIDQIPSFSPVFEIAERLHLAV